MSEFTDSELGAFLDGTIDGEKEARITAQLESDPELRERLEQLSGAGGFDRECAKVEASAEAAPEVQDLIEKIVGSVSEETPEPLSQSVYLRYLEPSAEENALGKLADYEILEVIAAGAMGVVFRARDNQLERIVAIKMLSPLYAESDVAKERFRREAKAVAAIEHPHVISIYSVDQSKQGLPFLVMNYVNGQSLSDLLLKLDGRSLLVSEILRIGKAVAAGLDAAHQQGLVHRDIKPSNILLEGEGPGVWITDFGLVRGRSEMTLTRTNMFLGTPEFAAPEQCAGQLVDERSDLFSFGAVLYYLATSRRPFQG
ncbi:MAG: serine/threonine-protein kinase, partial [Verrucomicrobiota bacterium]